MKVTTVALFSLLILSLSCTTNLDKSNQKGMKLRVELFTTDMEKSVNFYTNVLDFKMEGSAINHSYQPVKKGNVTLGIGPLSKLSEDHHFNPKDGTIQKGYGVEIVLEVDNVTEVYEQVESSGYPIHGPLKTQPWGLTDFRLVDPDGYYLRITSKNR
jgi:predicted enzyme related to lactoylglutathione lyase